MGKRGPKPKPTALKRHLGNPGKRTLNENEPLPPDVEVTAPSILRANARPFWDDMAPTLIAMKILTVVDAMAFARYCNLLVQYQALGDFLLDVKKGIWATTLGVKNEKGKLVRVVELPQSRLYKQVQVQMLAIEREFGLTPAARSTLRVDPNVSAEPVTVAPRDQELRDFFAGGGPAPSRVKKRGSA